MGVRLSDRLFVALAKKTGFPGKRLIERVRDLQLDLLAAGAPVTLFTLSRLQGVLSADLADRFVGWAREVVAQRPDYALDLFELVWQDRPGSVLDDETERRRYGLDELLDVLEDGGAERLASLEPQRAETERRRGGLDGVLDILEEGVAERPASFKPQWAETERRRDGFDGLIEVLDEVGRGRASGPSEFPGGSRAAFGLEPLRTSCDRSDLYQTLAASA